MQIKSLATPHACKGDSDPLSTLELASLTDEHVKSTVEAVAASDLVQAAWAEGRDLSVHGWVYHVATAKLRDLDCGFKGRESAFLSPFGIHKPRELTFGSRSGSQGRLALAPVDLRRVRLALSWLTAPQAIRRARRHMNTNLDCQDGGDRAFFCCRKAEGRGGRPAVIRGFSP